MMTIKPSKTIFLEGEELEKTHYFSKINLCYFLIPLLFSKRSLHFMTMPSQTIFSILLFLGWLFYGFILESMAPQDTQNEGGLLSPQMPTWQNEGDGSSPMIAQNEEDEQFSLGAHYLMNRRLYLSNKILAFWSTILLVLGTTKKRMTNSQIFWSFI